MWFATCNDWRLALPSSLTRGSQTHFLVYARQSVRRWGLFGDGLASLKTNSTSPLKIRMGPKKERRKSSNTINFQQIYVSFRECKDWGDHGKYVFVWWLIIYRYWVIQKRCDIVMILVCDYDYDCICLYCISKYDNYMYLHVCQYKGIFKNPYPRLTIFRFGPWALFSPREWWHDF